MKSIVIPVALGLISCAVNSGPVKRKMVGLLEKFDRWDYNGDGYLVTTELKDAALLSKLSEKEIIEFYDTNGDARISLIEAQNGMSRVDEAKEFIKEAGENQ